MEISVHMINARICEGIYLFHFLGNKKTISSVNAPIANASILTELSDLQIVSMLSIVFEQGEIPRSGLSCIIIIITPTPFIKPDITG